MKSLTLKDHRLIFTPNGGLEIENITRIPLLYRGEIIMPDSPPKMTIPSDEVSELRRFLNASAPES